MVVKHTPEGIVVTTRATSTSALDELLVCCGWPLLTEADARRLHLEQTVHDPACVLFWLDDWQSVSRSANLVTWLRERGARPFRIAVAYELEHDAEPVLRAAGAHSYVPIVGDVTRAVTGALWPLLDATLGRTSESVQASNLALAPLDHHEHIESATDFVRPP